MSQGKHTSLGLALGGGGVRGLAHIPVLEALDELNLRPAIVSGTSMGAIVGALYASGYRGREIRQLVEEHRITRDDGLKDLLAKKSTLLKWVSAIHVAWTGSGLLRADGFLHYLIQRMGVTQFEDLQIPLRVTATDFYTGECVVFDQGPLRPALEASMAIPGIFVPVEHEGRVLVDGGISNNLPYDLLKECSHTIAVDVSPSRGSADSQAPNMIDATLGMFDLLVEHLTKIKLESAPPDVYFHPRLAGVRVLEFDKADHVIQQTLVCLYRLKQSLQTLPLSTE